MTVTPITGVTYWYDENLNAFTAPGRPSLPLQAMTADRDWTDANPPWAYTDTSQFTQYWPAGLTETSLITGSGDLWNDLNNTLAPYPSTARVIVHLPAGTHHLKSFRKIGSGSSSLYAFGFWFSKLQGLISIGADKCFVQQDANSLSSAQLSEMMATKGYAADPPVFTPFQTGMARMDSTDPASPLLLAGFTWQAADQPNLTSVAEGVGSPLVYTPQPAPHQGLVLWQGSTARLDYMRFMGAGRAITSAPPGEMANMTTQYGRTTYNKVEFDGRRAASIDPARPRRCAPWMGNNEAFMQMTDVWMRYSNLSRHAVNDENADSFGPYNYDGLKMEHITENHNSDPAINGGQSLGGWTNATLAGWESCASPITILNSYFYIDNPFTDGGSIQHHLQFTNVGSRAPTSGGPLVVRGCTFRNRVVPQLDGFCQMRISTGTFWANNNYAAVNIYHKDSGAKLSPYVYNGTWPPTAAQLSAAGVSTTTHYLVRNS